MTKQSTYKEDLLRFSRVIVMLFNRATMYHVNHPYVAQSINDFLPAIQQVFRSVSPLVFILHLDQFFLDEEPIDSRTNVQRIASHFKKTGLQSISFESGLEKNEMKGFLEILTSLEEHPNAEAMKKAMVVKGIRNVKINHVFFKRVSQDDVVVSRDAAKKLTADTSEEQQRRSKKFLTDLVLEKLLTEELKETLTVENLLKNPAAMSQRMTETARGSFGGRETEGSGAPGRVLLRQLEMLGEELDRNFRSDGAANLQEIASALFEMKRRLLEGMEAQKALNVNYADEEVILEKANEITDAVVLRIIKDEYRGGKTSIERLAQILRRLVPDLMELKRLLPGIRVVLMEEGMSLTDYLHLVEELTRELQGDELARLLHRSSEEIGIDGQRLMEEVKKNPAQAAELFFLASEIGKASGDERVLADLLVDYVERLGTDLARDTATKNESATEHEQHFRKVISTIESRIVGRLKKMDVKDDLLGRLEQRFSKRIDEILEKTKLDWMQSHSPRGKTKARRELSALELLEHSVGESDELYEILAGVRVKVKAKEIDENDFGQIYAEITRQQQSRARETELTMPQGVLKPSLLSLVVEKEIARAKRYETPFSALSFSILGVARKKTEAPARVTYSSCMASVLKAISSTMRDADIVGEFEKNRIVLLLPMTKLNQAQIALKRCLKLLHTRPIDVGGVLVNIRVAGVATTYSAASTSNAEAFFRNLKSELVQMERRIKNIQTYF